MFPAIESFDDFTTIPFDIDEDLFDPGVVYPLPGGDAGFTRPFRWFCEGSIAMPDNTDGFFAANDIIIISNGMPGSTTSQFIRPFVELNDEKSRAKIVTTGGFTSISNMTTDSYAGGVVLSSMELLYSFFFGINDFLTLLGLDTFDLSFLPPLPPGNGARHIFILTTTSLD